MQIENKSDLKLIKHQMGIRNSDIYGDDLLLCVEGDSEVVKNSPDARVICNPITGGTIGPDAMWTMLRQLQNRIIHS